MGSAAGGGETPVVDQEWALRPVRGYCIPLTCFFQVLEDGTGNDRQETFRTTCHLRDSPTPEPKLGQF